MHWILATALQYFWGSNVVLKGKNHLNKRSQGGNRRIYLANHHSWQDVPLILSAFLTHHIPLPIVIASAHLNWRPLSWLLSRLGCQFLIPPKECVRHPMNTLKLFKKFLDGPHDLLLFIDGQRTAVEYCYEPKSMGLKYLFGSNPGKNLIVHPLVIQRLEPQSCPALYEQERPKLVQGRYQITLAAAMPSPQNTCPPSWKSHKNFCMEVKKTIQGLQQWSIETQIHCALFIFKRDGGTLFPASFHEENRALRSFSRLLCCCASHWRPIAQTISPSEFFAIWAHAAQWPPPLAALEEATYHSLPYLHECALFIRAQRQGKHGSWRARNCERDLAAVHAWNDFYCELLFQRHVHHIYLVDREQHSAMSCVCLQGGQLLIPLFLPLWRFTSDLFASEGFIVEQSISSLPIFYQPLARQLARNLHRWPSWRNKMEPFLDFLEI